MSHFTRPYTYAVLSQYMRRAKKSGHIRQQHIMVPRLLARALVCWLMAGERRGLGVKANVNPVPRVKVLGMDDGCPRCDMIFTMLKLAPSGERVQDIEMQERGLNARVVVVLLSHGMHTTLNSIIILTGSNHAAATYSDRRAASLAS